MPATYFGRVLALLCLLAPALHAQSTEADLKTRLMGKPLYLRGNWSDDNLRFDASGQLISHSGTEAFTVSGFDLATLTLKKNKLLLDGRRVGLEFEDDMPRRIALNVGKFKEHKDERLRIEIAAPPNVDYTALLDAIFADGVAQLAPSLPDYWQRYARKHFYDVPAAHDDRLSITQKPKKVGGEVKAPRPLHTVDPSFSNASRHMKYSGVSVINLWVGPDGLPSHISLVRPLGLGLDEAAVEAIRKYTFAPATQDDKPVTVELNIEVNFQIF